uniref:Uncharacterized protein n=1 Tax=Amphimedon queenslandica TaxID=400682 RepID=A0A1X7TMV9_AMPQE
MASSVAKNRLLSSRWCVSLKDSQLNFPLCYLLCLRILNGSQLVSYKTSECSIIIFLMAT